MSMKAGAKPSGLFANRFFQTVLLSNVLLQIGIWVRNFAILMYVTEMTNEDPVAISLIYVAEFLPIFVFSFIGGTFADRWRPKRTMIWCDLLSAVSVFAVMGAMMMGAWQAVFFATLVSAILSQFSQPSAMRMFKIHLRPEQIQQGMAFFQSLMAIFMVGGPSLGIFVYDRFGIDAAVAVMGVAFLLSAVVLFRLPEAETDVAAAAGDASATAGDAVPQPSGSFTAELMEGLRYVWRSTVLRTLGLTFALAGLGVGMLQPLGVFLVTEKLGQPKEFLQYLLMVNGAAMLVGGGVIAALSQKIAPQKLLAFGMSFGALTTAVMGWSGIIPLTLVMQFIGGLTFPAIHIGISTMILRWSDASIVGRVNGVLNPMFMGMMVVMIALSGGLLKLFPLEAMYTASAVIMVLGSAVLVPIFKHKPPAETAVSAPAAPQGMPSH